MEKPHYLSKYLFDWDLMDVIIGGKSALDYKFFISSVYSLEQVNDFLRGYGLDPNDPVGQAELFGNFQEAIQFVRRYFLKEGNPDGPDLKIPHSLFTITEITELFMMTTRSSQYDLYDQMWAEVILKIMHTILHVDKDLRSNYFSVIQTQIFDRFYKYIYRDESGQLFLGVQEKDGQVDHVGPIPLVDFETKAQKTRESVIIKLLHRVESVAEELFDTVGMRFITKTRFDTLRILKFLLAKNIVIPHNIKPSRSFNSLIDMKKFRKKHHKTVKMSLRNIISEERFIQALDRQAMECFPKEKKKYHDNQHSSYEYLSIQFTSRQLINYKNPFFQEFHNVRQMAKEMAENDELAKKVLSLDNSLITKNIRFFYPYEIQIVDVEGHRENTEGEASHREYKRAQTKSVIKRIFRRILDYKGIDFH